MLKFSILIILVVFSHLSLSAAEPVNALALTWTPKQASAKITDGALVFSADPGALGGASAPLGKPLSGVIVVQATCQALPAFENPNFTMYLGQGDTLAAVTIRLGEQIGEFKTSATGMHGLQSVKTETSKIPWVGTEAFALTLTLNLASKEMSVKINDWTSQAVLPAVPATIEQVGLCSWVQGIKVSSFTVTSK